MDESAAYIEDWSLQAIVRGSSGDFAKISDTEMDGQDSFLDFSGHHQTLDHEFLSCFPEIFEGWSDELEELYKPFYPLSHSLPVTEFQENPKSKNEIENNKQIYDASDHSSELSSATRVNTAYTPKYKRRKNQHKRVVIQVSAEGLGSDKWAWRKYGQKPIKGSPYPRSYYRCSSLKGCLARKQVEQSCTDPGMFIITYTAEHSHTQPTRRNSLAGTVRQKFPSSGPKNPNCITTATRSIKHEKIEESGSTSSKTLNNLQVEHANVKQEMKEDSDQTRITTTEESLDEDINDFGMSEMMFGDDFFSGLEEFDGFISEIPMFHASTQQVSVVRSCS